MGVVPSLPLFPFVQGLIPYFARSARHASTSGFVPADSAAAIPLVERLVQPGTVDQRDRGGDPGHPFEAGAESAFWCCATGSSSAGCRSGRPGQGC